MHAFPKGTSAMDKCKPPHSGFELWSLGPFLTTISITSQASSYLYNFISNLGLSYLLLPV